MLALIDGDIVTYRIGFTTENDPVEIAFARTSETIDKILVDTGSSRYRVYLTEDSDPDAFRKAVYPEYKAHRKAPRPKWYKEIRDYLSVEWGAITTKIIEADDQLGIDQIEANRGHNLLDQSVICSIDKDLKQIPGLHYDFVKEIHSCVTEAEGLKYFYKQLLTGDSADNIKGVWKVGDVKATKMLQNLFTEKEMFNIVRDAYANDEEMIMNGRVLWIYKRDNDDWIQHWERLSAECPITQRSESNNLCQG